MADKTEDRMAPTFTLTQFRQFSGVSLFESLAGTRERLPIPDMSMSERTRHRL